jgi:anti-anti-sigma factor
MSDIERNLSDDNQTLTVKITGEFGRQCLPEIREICSDFNNDMNEFHLDLTEASFIDSDASSYLLTLKNPARDNNIKLRITENNKQIKTTLRLMGIDKIFSVN